MSAPAIPAPARGGRDVPWDVSELRRRIDHVARIAVVAAVDADAARLRARWGEGADGAPALTGWLPWLAGRAGADAAWWAPEVGEQVLLIAPGGELAAALALPGLYSDSRPAPSSDPDASTRAHSDGASVLYDRGAHVLRHAAADGAVVEYDGGAHALRATLPDGATVAVVADGGVAITGDVTVTGDVAASGEVADSVGPMSRMRSQHNAHAHPAGSPPGNTRAPTTRMD